MCRACKKTYSSEEVHNQEECLTKAKKHRPGPVTLTIPQGTVAAKPALSPELETEFLRWCDALGREEEQDGGTVDSRTVLRAHFLVAEYFHKPGRGMASVGPKNLHLLQSAVARQFVSFDGHRKWSDDTDICATLFFGLVKNHAFHDANKRTALLTALYQLQTQGRVPTAPQKAFEEITLRVAEGDLPSCDGFEEFAGDADAEVRFISWFFRRNTRISNKREHFVSFKQLERMLERFGYYFGVPHGNRIDVLHLVTERYGFLNLKQRSVEKRVTRIGFRNMGTDVAQQDMKDVRRATGLTAENGYDSDVLFGGLDPMESLIAEYNEPLRRLAKK